MAQFTLGWDNSEVEGNANNISQRASYRGKTEGGAWLTTGFTPANDMDTDVNSAQTDNSLLSNTVYEFKVESICTQNGPTANDNGIIEQIGFACIAGEEEHDINSSTLTVNVADTDITKISFHLKQTDDDSEVFTQEVARGVGDTISSTATGLEADTGYYWLYILHATVNGQEVLSTDEGQIEAPCDGYIFNTDADCLDLETIDVDAET